MWKETYTCEKRPTYTNIKQTSWKDPPDDSLNVSPVCMFARVRKIIVCVRACTKVHCVCSRLYESSLCVFARVQKFIVCVHACEWARCANTTARYWEALPDHTHMTSRRDVKRDLHMWKQTYKWEFIVRIQRSDVERHIRTIPTRHQKKTWKETWICAKRHKYVIRDLNVWKEIHTCGKRPAHM